MPKVNFINDKDKKGGNAGRHKLGEFQLEFFVCQKVNCSTTKIKSGKRSAENSSSSFLCAWILTSTSFLFYISASMSKYPAGDFPLPSLKCSFVFSLSYKINDAVSIRLLTSRLPPDNPATDIWPQFVYDYISLTKFT
jgi:hypothetical protein